MKPLLQLVRQGLSGKYVRPLGATLILLITIIVFVVFFKHHSDYIRNLRHVQPLVIIEIIALNALLTVVLTVLSILTLRLCGIRLSFKENFLLTAYSSIANFFGPLQSGPGVRAVYLKSKHHVRMRDYTLATLIQYGMFAVISAALLFGGSLRWWLALPIFLVVTACCLVVIRLYMKRSQATAVPSETTQFHFDVPVIGAMVVATLAMAAIVTTYYFIELRAVSPLISLHQAIIYSGAANFALFVSLTPDAIGIRESFLVLSRRLHHISTPVILAANIIDRGAYLLFLLVLFLFILAVHGRDRLQLRQVRRVTS